MPKTLESYIERIERAKSVNDAFDSFTAIMLDYGFDKVTYSLLTDHPSLMLPKMHGLATSYPEEWMKHYVANDYLDIDAVVIGCKKIRTPFFWKDLEKDKTMSEESLSVLNMGAEAGVKDGIAIPLLGLGSELTAIGLARSNEEKSNDRDYKTLAETNLISNFFHQKFRSLLIDKHQYYISDKERDILSWAAEGKTDQEIAVLMNIGHRTVRFHWSRIFTKLETNGRIPSVTKSIALGLIEPRFVIGNAKFDSC